MFNLILSNENLRRFHLLWWFNLSGSIRKLLNTAQHLYWHVYSVEEALPKLYTSRTSNSGFNWDSSFSTPACVRAYWNGYDVCIWSYFFLNRKLRPNVLLHEPIKNIKVISRDDYRWFSKVSHSSTLGNMGIPLNTSHMKCNALANYRICFPLLSPWI